MHQMLTDSFILLQNVNLSATILCHNNSEMVFSHSNFSLT